MAQDFRKEFSSIRPKILKQWAVIIVIFLGAIPYVAIVSAIFGEDVAPMAFLLYGFMYLYAIFRLYLFKCPNCNKSLYAVVEVFHIPLLVKTWVSTYCTHCGARLK